MKYALFIAEGPVESGGGKPSNWSNFLGTCRDLEREGQLAGATGIGQGVYFLDLQKDGLHPLGHLVRAAKDYEFASRTLFFEQMPAFVDSM
jgi:hypothetical protein